MLSFRSLFVAVGLSAALVVPAVHAQGDRPKVGLALSGGGAKGAAHIGVIRALEELRVPIDYIAGTSMGAIVGGLYASGIPSAELERIMLETDWADALNDRPSRSELFFRRKEDDARYLLDLQLGLGQGGLKWPTGLISGQKLYFMLQAYTLPVAGVRDFDELPIPFRCVATDIRNGEMVLLSSGSLASALRASMAIPTAFSPVELDGRLLVDGAVTRNLPVDVVLEMGADVVIAVDLEAPLTEWAVDSMVQILSQTTRLLMRGNVEPQLELADVVLRPEVNDFAMMQFSAVREMIDLGYEETRSRSAELEGYSVATGESHGPIVQLDFDRPPTKLADIRFEGNRRVDDRVIRSRIRLQPGSPFDLDAIEADLKRVYGLGDFESVSFELEPGDGGPTLVFHLKEKSWGPNFLQFGFTFNTDFSGDTDAGLLTNLTTTRLNPLGGEWRTDLLIGNSWGLFSEFYQPLDFRGRWFVAPYVDVDRERRGFYEDGSRLAEFVRRWQVAGIDLGLQVTRFAEIRVGYLRGLGSAKLESGQLPEDLREAEASDFDLGGLRLRATFDLLDASTFPREGGTIDFNWYVSRESLGADDDYNRWEARLSQFWTFGKNTLLVNLNGGWSPGSELPAYDEFTLGGLLSLSGFADDELRGQAFAVGRLGFYRKTFGPVYLGGFLEAGNIWQSSEVASFEDLIFAGTVFAGMDTRLGPVYLAYGHNDEGSGTAYIVFGRTF